MPSIALCFPGQGSQAPSMAAGLLDSGLGRELAGVAAAEGLDLEQALGATDAEALRPTGIAQPALLLVETALAALLPDGLEIAGVAGHSVGEYAACVAAGALEPADAMRLVVRRGRAMAAMNEGTMAALLGLDAEAVEAVCAEVSASGQTVVVANLNAPGQVVISGDVNGVAAASDLARQRGARRAVPLNVSGAFHSPLMADAAAEFARELEATTFRDTRVPVVSNVDAEALTDGGAIRDRLRRQLEAPVRWTDCVGTLQRLGAGALVEVGPGNVLTGLARRIAPGLTAIAVGAPEAARGLGSALGEPARG